jgi:hypothetical protein
MAHLSVTYMADDSIKFILIVGMLFREIRFIELFALIVVKSVRIKIEVCGEFVFVGKFLIDESLEIHVDSLEMNDEIMRRFTDSRFL